MGKILKVTVFCLLIVVLVWFGSVLADRKILSEDIIRLHVVADSDSEEDQTVKLQVRDAVTQRLEGIMDRLPGAQEARAYILMHMDELEDIANDVLDQVGSHDRARVTLTEECFDTRQYDTFSLPAGVYESLRVTIGSGEGKNWWCVVFPTLCSGTNAEDFADEAAGAFDSDLTAALENDNSYEIRFFFLDLLGRIQNFFHRN